MHEYTPVYETGVYTDSSKMISNSTTQNTMVTVQN